MSMSTYETGAWLFAAELNLVKMSRDWRYDDADSRVVCVMANYAYSDVASVTARISHGRT